MIVLLLQLFLIIALIGTIAWSLWPLFRDRDYGDTTEAHPRWAGFIIAAFLFVLFVGSTGIRQIDAGHVGVVRENGRVTGTILQPGLSLTTPIITSVDDVDVRVRQIRIEGYTAASKEQQDLFLNLTLNYHVDPQQAANIVQNIGSDFEAKIVQPRLLDIPKSVTDDYPTTIVLNSRDEIRSKATELLREALAPYGFVVDNIAFENFGYSPEYNASIEAKQIAQQQVETEKQKLAQQEQIALQKIAAAHGEAEAQIERARGEAESNRLVAASLTNAILINRYIEKLGPDIKAMLVPSEGGFILNLGDQLNGAASPAPAATAKP